MINGTITLTDGTKIEVTDKIIAANSLSIRMSTASSTFDIGSFNAAVMEIKIIDSEALDHDFDGAEIALREIKGKEGETTDTSLGLYYVNGEKTVRTRNLVKLTAQDKSVLFDGEINEADRNTEEYTPLELLNVSCSAAGVTLATTDLSALPNNDVKINIKSASIQTYRDAVMWVAQLLCSNAVINRYGELEIRRAKYISAAGTTDIIHDYVSDGSDRVDIQFSDTRTFIKYLSAYSGKTVKEYVTGVTASDPQVREGMFSLPFNPLLESKSADDCDDINEAWHEFIDTFATRYVKATMFSNTKIKLGDTVSFKGGKVDVRKNIVGVVTAIYWRYRGYTTVICTAPPAAKT